MLYYLAIPLTYRRKVWERGQSILMKRIMKRDCYREEEEGELRSKGKKSSWIWDGGGTEGGRVETVKILR